MAAQRGHRSASELVILAITDRREGFRPLDCLLLDTAASRPARGVHDVTTNRRANRLAPGVIVTLLLAACTTAGPGATAPSASVSPAPPSPIASARPEALAPAMRHLWVR